MLETHTHVTPDCKDYVNVAIQAYKAQAWGTSSTQISRYNLSTSSAGPRSGLQLILSVLPEQYCVGSITQNTFGFFALPHARDVGPVLALSPNIEIPAGFVADVAITVTQITRHTESIGKCQSKKKLQWYPNLPSYSYDACLLQCFALIFNDPKLCDCVPYFSPPYMFTSGQAYSFDSEGNSISRFCEVDQAKPCYMNLLRGMNYSAYAAIPKGYTQPYQFLQNCTCPKQCEETQYRTDVSYSPLASPTSFKAMLANPNISVPTDLTELRKSFAVVNFYYKDVQVRSYLYTYIKHKCMRACVRVCLLPLVCSPKERYIVCVRVRPSPLPEHSRNFERVQWHCQWGNLRGSSGELDGVQWLCQLGKSEGFTGVASGEPDRVQWRCLRGTLMESNGVASREI